MTSSQGLKQLAKFTTYVLGRHPDEFGLVLDAQGFVTIKALLKAICEEDGWRHVRRHHFTELVISLAAPPVEIDGRRIRACDRTHLPRPRPVDRPPGLLYGCVRRRAYPHVRQKGLYGSGDDWVRLAGDIALAERIGRRMDTAPVVLTIHVGRCLARGLTFYRYGDALFLAEYIPPDGFTGPALPKPKIEARKEPAEETPKAPPGSFFVDAARLDRTQKGKPRKKDAAWKKERRSRKRR
jgi:putative RNA 2'-phosphotransferase